ncbi:MAG: hypothetical protein JSS12_03560 [Verrucomicrobia bacterium]|nr:hypothetical protein [Verrucomicrobiota bacterium]
MKRLLTLLLLLAAQATCFAAVGDIKIWTMKSGYSIAFPDGWRRMKPAQESQEHQEMMAIFNHYIPHVAYTETMASHWYQKRALGSHFLLHVFKQPTSSGMQETLKQVPAILQELGFAVEKSGILAITDSTAMWWLGTAGQQMGYFVCFGNNDFSCVAYFTAESIDSDAIKSYNSILKTLQFPN